jgi:hypothetical protein
MRLGLLKAIFLGHKLKAIYSSREEGQPVKENRNKK